MRERAMPQALAAARQALTEAPEETGKEIREESGKRLRWQSAADCFSGFLPDLDSRP